ncbi:alpha/beta fold hydrolase [Marinomonas mediterranea]|jgi:Predicted hydrolases or acyltransferases (alpha/beta hydrolase superfamily)|uniref:Alpha/beta hydrolase fold protein n=1 Tax=Marinomonas mediterranea (strain ATCC 700492 / JCM 21426 / NBRC 103028 / MMB-1) TaxID=717774 RepID=F2JTH0_MARM1|nr:alpha/beta hydrolase [Marinomonas mediterranea]ADZ91484.1 alpha/beta hydrolase fold protein [Marinomonas mediterranea MMB-1]WCN09451.1 alpha/beta fold hydrolase [Marinomonas mediterranea]WCN13527.1 alpha/beta fold hydrolase [Marinomonas mediterranea]WCN17593.1 alpha/beta fold hydrolase [Marinomonas mediterranea MMB-1]
MPNDVFYTLRHTRLAAKQWRSTNPNALRVLGLHGWMDNAATFDHLAPYLNEFNFTALDLAGHGFSEHRSDGAFYHMWDHALDVISVLQLSNESSWLIGHSMGGGVALLVAALAPEKVRGLIILDSMGPATSDAQERVSTMQRAVQKMLKLNVNRPATYPSIEDMVYARANGFTQMSMDSARILVERGAYQDDESWYWRHDNKLAFPSPYRMDDDAVASFVHEVKCPTLALLANQGLYVDKKKQVDKRANEFSWIKMHWLEGNHHFHLEKESVLSLAEHITHFIDKN